VRFPCLILQKLDYLCELDEEEHAADDLNEAVDSGRNHVMQGVTATPCSLKKYASLSGVYTGDCTVLNKRYCHQWQLEKVEILF
jgi:hypothetical protein